jgi:hypothetical protein
MSLVGSWDFEVTHNGAVYKCHVRDDRVEIEHPSGMTTDAKWTGDGLGDWCGFEGDLSDETLPDAVAGEVESQMRDMAETLTDGGPCPACNGEGGRSAEECPSITTEWIECKACDGSGEYWPDEGAAKS